jgi:hypothetical protein
MKRISLVFVLLLLAFNSNSAQKTIKQVRVTGQTIADLPEGGAYIIDLTHKGLVYIIDADVDHSRLRVRTSKGAAPMSQMLARSGRSGKSIMGHANDIRFQELEMKAARRGWTYLCSETTCYCRTLDDCESLAGSDKCKGSWTCDKNGCTCNRLP